MIVLDTNVVSQMMMPPAGNNADRWIDTQDIDDLAITSITFEEVVFGLNILPTGKRRQLLSDGFNQVYGRIRCLHFTDIEAAYCGQLRAKRRRSGRPINLPDAQIAGIAIRHNAHLATRNVRDFIDLDLHIINPWDFK